MTDASESQATAVGLRGRCGNCEAAITDAYCAHCGQEQAWTLSWKEMLGSAISEIASVDAPLIRTIRELTTHPGRVCRDYLAGRRKPYVQPAKYVLLTATLVLIVWQLAPQAGTPNGAPSAGDTARVFRIISSFWGYYLFPLLVPVAGLQALLFRRDGLRAVQCYVFDLYVFGHILWLNALSALFGFQPSSVPGLIGLVVQVAYVISAVNGFHSEGVIGSVIKGTALYVAYLASAMLMGFVTYGVLRLV